VKAKDALKLKEIRVIGEDAFESWPKEMGRWWKECHGDDLAIFVDKKKPGF